MGVRANDRGPHPRHSDRNAFASNRGTKIRRQDRRRSKNGIHVRFASTAHRGRDFRCWSNRVRQAVGRPRPSVNSASITPATPVNTTIAAREPMVAVPETKPATIEGWTVLDVRGGTVVLEGPDGVRTAARGDTVPGIGRINSIVRWGNRWIVATASGLIATR